MKNYFKSKLFFIILCTASLFLFKPVLAESLNHLIITEIQIAGKTLVDDEFIELYNPTDQAIGLIGWKLTKKTSSGNEYTILSSQTSVKLQGVVASQRYFLIAHPKFSAVSNADVVHSGTQSLASDNTLILYDKLGVVDRVGWGSVADAVVSNPAAGKSLERKKDNNFYLDIDNNGQDFFIQNNPNPQNSSYETQSPPPGPVCGNNICESGENFVDCLADCPVVTPTPVCGNGLIETNETCDDGNTIDNDNCSALCQIEQSVKNLSLGDGDYIVKAYDDKQTELVNGEYLANQPNNASYAEARSILSTSSSVTDSHNLKIIKYLMFSGGSLLVIFLFAVIFKSVLF